MKKLYWTRALKLAALVIPLVLFLMLGQTVLAVRGNYNSVRLRGFYEEPENSLDVVFIGASDVFTGYSPAYAYDQFGYTSYMYATASTTGTLYPYFLNEILSRQDPQLIVVEVHGYLHEDEYLLRKDAPRRYFAECAPWSVNKIKAILNYETDESKLSYFIPFAKYHGEWQEFAEIKENKRYREEIFGHQTLLKGSAISARYDPVSPIYEVQNDFSVKPLDVKTGESLMEFLRICKQKDLKNVVFVRFPHRMMEEEYEMYQRANTVEQIVTEHGFRFINLERKVDEIGIDYAYDFYDNDHLNVDGQKKFTEYLGKLIREEYVTEPIEQTAENKAQWDVAARYVPLFWEKARQMLSEGNFELAFESPEIMEDLNASYHMGQQ